MKAYEDAGIAKMSDEQRQQIEDIVAAYSYEQWDELIPEIQAVLETTSRDVAVEAVKQIYGEGALSEEPAEASSAQAGTAATPPATTATPAALAAQPGTAPGTPSTPSAAIRGYFNQVNEQAADYASDRAAELVGRRLVDGELVDNPDAKWAITETTRDWLRESVTAAFEDGMSPAQLGKAIVASPAFSKSRAKMIAHTEIGNANMQTLETASVAAGATHKRSFLSADHDHDDQCDDAAEAGEVPIDFVYPGGYLRPLYHPRCKCSESYYVRREKVPTQ